MVNKYFRGSVWWYDRQPCEKCITYGTHPCVIISSDDWNDKAGTVVVVPCTTNQLVGTAKDIKLDMAGIEGNFFCSQITTIPKSSLHDFCGVLSPSDMEVVTKSVGAILQLCDSSVSDYINIDRPEASYRTGNNDYDSNYPYMQRPNTENYRNDYQNNSRRNGYAANNGNRTPRYHRPVRNWVPGGQSNFERRANPVRRDFFDDSYRESARRVTANSPVRNKWNDANSREFYNDMYAAMHNAADLQDVCDKWHLAEGTAIAKYRKLSKQFG